MKQKQQRGITLIALVITIIIMLILVSVTINMTINGGLFDYASKAVIETALAALKEEVILAKIEYNIENQEEMILENLLEQGKIKRSVIQEGNDYYLTYVLNKESWKAIDGFGKGVPSSGRDIFVIDNNFNVKYIAKDGKEYGDNIEATLLEDETDIRFLSATFARLVSNKAGVSENEMKFKWMKNQTSLKIDATDVTSLEDLVFFPNLTTLDIGSWGLGNNRMNLDNLEGIANCTKLNTLNFFYTNLNSFKGIEGCSNLKTITYQIGKVEDFSSVASCINLTSFKCFSVQADWKNVIDSIKDITTLKGLSLTSIKFTSFSMKDLEKIKGNLTSLSLDNAKISKIEGINKFTNLEKISLSSNEIVDITPLAQNIKLKTIDLSSNKIIDITPLAQNTQLNNLNLKNNPDIDENRENYTGDRLTALNKIGSILDNDGVINVDIDKLKLFTNYKTLDLSSQKLENVECLEGLTQLESLSLSKNSLLTLEDQKSQDILKSMTELKELGLQDCPNVTNISFINQMNKLEILNTRGSSKMDLKQIQNKISNLSIKCNNESFLSIANCDANVITKINIFGWDGLSTVVPDFSKFTNLTNIQLANNGGIQDFSNLSKVTSLVTLNLSKDSLHDRMIDFSKLTNLTLLNLSGNGLWSEDLTNLKSLKNNKNLTIDLSNNVIVDATELLVLDPSTKIKLEKNINLLQDSKDKLKERFGSNVSF